MGHHYIGTEHLLLGLVRQNEGVAMDVLKKLGISAEQIRRQTRRVLQENPVQSQQRQPVTSQGGAKKEKAKTPLVDQLATDLTPWPKRTSLTP
jgi:ATP-dependent Clp protease ATP-binding subunit ClpC